MKQLFQTSFSCLNTQGISTFLIQCWQRKFLTVWTVPQDIVVKAAEAMTIEAKQAAEVC